MVALIISCFGALVTEMSGLAGVGQLFGVPVWQTVGIVALAIFVMVCSGNYNTVERVAQLKDMPLSDRNYLYLLAANLDQHYAVNHFLSAIGLD